MCNISKATFSLKCTQYNGRNNAMFFRIGEGWERVGWVVLLRLPFQSFALMDLICGLHSGDIVCFSDFSKKNSFTHYVIKKMFAGGHKKSSEFLI